jgi:hypothetical protein
MPPPDRIEHFTEHVTHNFGVRLIAHYYNLGPSVHDPDGRFRLYVSAQFSVMPKQLQGFFLAI